MIFVFLVCFYVVFFFFFQAEDGIRDLIVTGVQTCALPISFLDGRQNKQEQMLARARNDGVGLRSEPKLRPQRSRNESPIQETRTGSRGTGCTPRGGTALRVSSQMCPELAGTGRRTRVSSHRNGPSRRLQIAWWSTRPFQSSPAPCRCCPANSAPPAEGS